MHPEVEIRRWTEADYQPAAAVITAAYRGHVDAEINDQYRTLSGSLRFLNNIVRFPGCGTFDPEGFVRGARSQVEGLVGLILCSRVRSDVGHVTQVCVLPEYRSRGLGESLIAATRGNLRKTKFLAAVAHRDGGQCTRGDALSTSGFRYEEGVRCVRVGRVAASF